MSRSILNQNTNSRNILNIKYKNLLDGKAIKISDRNEINVNFITNTEEELTFNDNDLFLLSNPDGDNIKYTTGLTIKQGANNSLIAGNNINFTISGNNRVINVKDVITGLTSINDFTLVTNISSSANQFLLKDNSVGAFATDSFLTTNASGLIAPKTEASVITTVQGKILAGINIVRTLGLNSTLTLALSDALINLASVNGYVFNTTTNSTVNQFLLKDTTVGSFASGDFLTINSSNKVDNISRIDLNNSIVSQVFVTNGLSRTLITNNGYSSISISTTPSINLSDTMTLLNTAGEPPNNGGDAILKIQAGGSASFKPQIQLFQDATLRTSLEYDKTNNKFLINAPSGSIDLSAYNGVNINTKIGMNSNPINLGSSIDTNHQILYSGSGMDGVLVRGFGINSVPFFRLQASNGSVNILDAYADKIIALKTLYMSGEKISFQNSDTNHYIQYSGTGMNGVEIGGYGFGSTAFFKAKCSDGGGSVFECFKEKVVITKPLVFYAGITDTAQIDYNNAKQLSVNIVAGGEFRIDNGGVNYFKTIAQGGGANGRTFFFEQGGDSNTSNGGSFQAQCSQGKMLFQSDRNLVIYRPDSSVSWASGGGASSRDYKKNINDLVESDSINVIKNINPVSYEYKEKYWDSIDSCDACNCNLRKGFIWEDMKPILPQSAKSINMDNPDIEMTKLLDLKEIIPDLVKTVQYLLNKVETLESQINNNI